MTPAMDLMLDSLEKIAERHGDLVPLVYGRFYLRYPDTRQMFGRDENHVHQGHMFNGMLMAVLEQAEGRCFPGSITAWVMDHDLWGVKREMFRAMFDALYETIRECLGDDWNDALERAWSGPIGALADRFDQACEAARLHAA